MAGASLGYAAAAVAAAAKGRVAMKAEKAAVARTPVAYPIFTFRWLALREARLQLFKAVQKSPKLLATGQRAKAPTAAQESLRAINAAATKLLSATNASLSDLTEALSLLEDAQLWVLDPGSSKAQDNSPSGTTRLAKDEFLRSRTRYMGYAEYASWISKAVPELELRPLALSAEETAAEQSGLTGLELLRLLNKLKAPPKGVPEITPEERHREVKRREFTACLAQCIPEKQLAEEALYGSGRPDEVVASRFSVEVTRRQMECLRPGEWLNDEDYNYKEVRRWTVKAKVDIFEMDYVIFPMNIGESHWAMGAIDLKEKGFRYFDSMFSKPPSNFVAFLRRYLQDEHKAKKGKEISGVEDWQLLVPSKVPQQKNGYDCGVFTCFFADCFSAGKSLSFEQEDMPTLRMRYPSDAEEHFLEVNRTLASFLPRHVPMHKWLLYQGPWIENFWINRFSQKWLERPRGTRLHEIFGPFIPIFVPFVDLKVMMKGKYPPGLMEALNRTLRRDCLYVTVSQHDEGLFGMPRGAERKQVDRIQQSSIPNLLVFSAGGYGHVPLPLLKQPEEPLPATPRLAQRPFFAGFVGGKNAPAVRTQMCDDVRSWADKNQKEVKFIFGYEDVPALRAKLKRFQALVENAREVEGLSKKEKKAEADRLRIDLAGPHRPGREVGSCSVRPLGQLVAPQDDERRALANDFREVCDLLDRRITRARNRRRSSSSQEDDGHSSVLGWITNLWPLHRKEPQVQQVQVDVRAPLQEWSATESFQARPIPRLDAASLNRLTADARMLSEATERVASMVQQQDESLDAVEDDVHQTVEDTVRWIHRGCTVRRGKSRSRVSKATIAVGASSAVMGMVLGAPLLGTLALASGTATVTALAGNAIHGRYRRKV
eukprot:g6453.t1